MGLDDKVYAEVDSTESRNENLDGGKSTACHPDEAEVEKQVAKQEDKSTEPRKDPDEVKSTSELLPEDAQKKSDLSAGDSA